MNVSLARPPSASVWDHYLRLPSGPKLLLRLKSLIGSSVTKTEFIDCLKATGLRTPEGKAWSPQLVNAQFADLRAEGLLTDDNACPPALLHRVAADAGASEDAAARATAIRRLFPAQRRSIYSYSSTDTVRPDALYRLIRLAVYTNEAAEFIASRDLCDKTSGPHSTVMLLANTFYNVPLEPDWVSSRDPAIQTPLLEAKLNAFIVTGLSGPEMPALIALCRRQQGQPGFSDLRIQLLRYDLLAGRLEDVRDAVKAIEDSAGDTKQALEGAVAFFDGHNEVALLHYRNALKLRRKPAWCRDQRCVCNDPNPRSGSDDADIARASEHQHAVEDIDRHVDFSHPTFVDT